MARTRKVDWLRVVIHAIFGIVLGGFMGLGSWVRWNGRHPTGADLAWRVGIGAVLLGILCGIYGDRLWFDDE